MNRRVALIAISAALAGPATASAQDTTSDHTLSVVGSGETELTPDRGSFSAEVARRAKSAEAARRQASRRITAVVRAVLAEGVARERIATDAVSVRRVRPRKRPAFFLAAVSVTVRIDGIERLGRALDAATRGGATSVYGPELSFTPARRAEGLRIAEAAALVDARTRAEAAAAAEGQRITGIKSIDLDPAQDAFYDSAADSGASGGESSERAPSTPIEAGLQTFTSLARVTFLIEPAA